MIIAYDDQARAPEARQELHAKRYRKLPAAPVTMNRRTHTFVNGRSGPAPLSLIAPVVVVDGNRRLTVGPRGYSQNNGH